MEALKYMLHLSNIEQYHQTCIHIFPLSNDFKNSVTGTLCRKLVNIPPPVPCETLM